MMVDRLYTWTILIVTFSIIAGQTSDVDFLAEHLVVHWEVLQNPHSPDLLQYTGTLTFINGGPRDIQGNNWEIYFCSIRLMFPNQLKGTAPEFGHLIGETNIEIYHLNGCLHKLKPTADFKGFVQGFAIILPYEGSDWSVSRTDIMPRWYVTDGNRNGVRTIASTSNEELDFVADFDTAAKWKRLVDLDQYDPYTPEVRFNKNTDQDMGKPGKKVIPTPVNASYDDTLHVNIMSGDWLVVYSSEEVKPQADFLAAQWKTEAVDISSAPTNRYVLINIGEVYDGSNKVNNTEAYEFHVMPETSVINITGTTTAGAFYGIQSLLSLSSYSSNIPKASITDYPRFPYRGMHIDVGRNFHPKEDIFQLLDVMAMYKLNKFYFHITDDEGWRLEINGLPELTSVGAQRCFDLDEDECIISQLGSGPTSHTSGSGYYSVDDYKEILRYADERNIQVTPEFDMPGHMHAAIKAMEARYRRLNDSQYLLNDIDDNSMYLSVQLFRDNAVNPCLKSTYNFVRKVVEEIKAMHQGIQPLQAFNFGGDEVSPDAWVSSPVCEALIANDPDLQPDNYTSKNTILHRYFVKNVSAIAHENGLDIAGWEDGLKFNHSAMNRTDLPNDNAYVFAWNNVWEWGDGERAYEFANEGYKVVISHATHLYFDHPQEPDPEERGFYWATRFTDLEKTFGFYADDVYENIEENLYGQPLSREDFCRENTCEALEEDKIDNVIGLQGHLWSETVRTSEQLHDMIYPRILAMAERAWHKASWEDLSACGENCNTLKAKDWAEFANTLGYKELRRLSEMGIKYHVPPPGARITEEDGMYRLEVNVDLPGQPVVYSTDNGDTWKTIHSDSSVTLEADQQIHIHVRSVDLGRSGRSITLQTGGPVSGECRLSATLSLLVVNFALLLALLT